MGVPAELLGRQVRCPHCKQVVVAPATVGPAPAPVAPPPPPPPEPAPKFVAPAPPPPPAPDVELRPFNIPAQKEGADSILSESDESEDEVFGSNPGARLQTLPPAPAPEPPAPAAHTFSSGPAPVMSGPLPGPLTGTVFPFPPAPVPQSPAKQEPLDPFDDLGPAQPAPQPPPAPQPAPRPFATAPLPQPVPAPFPMPAPTKPAPAPVPAPAPASSNPFAAFDAPPQPAPARAPQPAPEPDVLPEPEEDEQPRKKKKKRQEQDEEPEEKPARAAYGRAAGGSGGASKTVLLVLLGGYALVATALAVYGLFFSSGVPAGHPLSTIPDNFGEFDPVSRRKVSRATFPVDGALPPEQRAALGGKVLIGQLEVQPIKIEKRGLEIHAEGTDEKEKITLRPGKALVMTLDIKNTSPDLPIFPMDPAFTRREKKDDQPITRLVTGKRTFYGGEIEWPLAAAVKKKIEVQQGNDAIPLRPGESREYVVFTAASTDLIRTTEADRGPLQWRVQLRRGLIEYKGKDVPVTAIVGVDFKASDIRGAE